MHARNPYRRPPDYAALAEAYPALKSHVKLTVRGHPTIDYRNDVSQRCLTRALLFRDFGIALTIPEDRLCPPVPNRLNYILWIQDIVQACGNAPSASIKGIDIGTGASAIYPLLGCSLNASWDFAATEVDTVSLNTARANVILNNLQHRIQIVPATLDGSILLPLAIDETCTFDFTMCNPPFYSSKEDMERSLAGKDTIPNAVCTGADVEMITAGGERAFVGRMVTESLRYRTRCRWYTSMLGKLASLTDVVNLLHQHSIENYGITEFVQGETRRWAIAWSFTDIRLPDTLTQISNRTIKSLLPPRNTLKQAFSHAESAHQLNNATRTALDSIDGLSIDADDSDDGSRVVSAYRNTWSRAARRRMKTGPEAETTSGGAVLVCRVWCESAEVGAVLGLDWQRGKERGLFEGFASHLWSKVGRLFEQQEEGASGESRRSHQMASVCVKPYT